MKPQKSSLIKSELNEENLIHGRETETISKSSAQNFRTSLNDHR